MSHYATLGVDKTATQSEIKKAYRKLCIVHHPDKGGDENRFKEIADAYAVIGDQQKRQQYDAVQDNPFANFGNMGGMDGNFGDLFNQFFGQQRQQTRGSDIRVDMHISFDEAFHGCTKVFQINGLEHTIDLKRGVRTGQRFRLAGKGQAHPFNTQLPPGDLFVTIHVQLNSEFILEGNNIWVDVTLPWFEIMSGTKVTINSLDGPISITVPEGTAPGKVLRVREKGWPDYDTQIRGSLLCKINASYPELNELQLEYIKKVYQNKNG